MRPDPDQRQRQQPGAQAGLDPDGKPAMHFLAHDKLHYEERDYAYEARLFRTGPAQCRAEPAS